jgi:hypothetical protein
VPRTTYCAIAPWRCVQVDSSDYSAELPTCPGLAEWSDEARPELQRQEATELQREEARQMRVCRASTGGRSGGQGPTRAGMFFVGPRKHLSSPDDVAPVRVPRHRSVTS